MKNLGDMAKRFIQQEIQELQSHPQSQQQGYPTQQQPFTPPQGYAPAPGYPPASPGYQGYASQQPVQPDAWQPQIFGGRPQAYVPGAPPQSVTGSGPVATGSFVPPNPYFTPTQQPGYEQQPYPPQAPPQGYAQQPNPPAGNPPQGYTQQPYPPQAAPQGYAPAYPQQAPRPGYPPQASQQGYTQPPYAPQPPQQGYPPQAPQQGGLLGGAGGGLLAGLAGGVAGGLAGEAIGNALFGHHNPVVQQPEEVIVNNYYEQPAQGYQAPDVQPADFSNSGVDQSFDPAANSWSGGPDQGFDNSGGGWSDGSDTGGSW